MNDEEWLSGLLDGELDPAGQAQAEALIARDPALRDRLEHMRRTDALVRRAGESLAAEEVPARFVKAIDAALEKQWPDQVGGGQAIPSAANDSYSDHWRVGGAIAASLAVGLFLGTQLARPDGETLIAPALANALETVPSGQSITLASGERLTPRLTFASKDGGFCRQYVLDAAARNRAGLACRSDDRWNVEALIPQDMRTSAQLGYVVAEGSSGTEMDGLMAKLRTGDPLDSIAETRLIENNWRRP